MEFKLPPIPEKPKVIKLNMRQRQILADQITLNFKIKITSLKESIPHKPSLNNYLVAAFLDGSIKFNDVDQLKQKMTQRVRRYGEGMRVCDGNDDVNVKAEELFIIPNAYEESVQEYYRIKKDVEKQISDLTTMKDTLMIKIQVGSNEALTILVNDIDTMGGQLNLNFANSLLISNGNESD